MKKIIPKFAWWPHWKWKNEKEIYDYVIKMINKKNGFMSYFIDAITFAKVPFEVFLEHINKFHKPKILVIGSIPIHAIYLSYFYDVDVICPYKTFIKLNKEMNEVYRGNVNILGSDTINIEKNYDIIYCGFTYENYERENTIKLIKAHLNKCKKLIIYVPTNPEYCCKEWKEMIEKSGGRIIETYGVDYPKIFRFANYIKSFSKWFRIFSKNKIFIVIK